MEQVDIARGFLARAELDATFSLEHIHQMNLLHHAKASFDQLPSHEELAHPVWKVGMQTLGHIVAIEVPGMDDEVIEPRHFHQVAPTRIKSLKHDKRADACLQG